MTLISADQAIFFSVSVILLTCLANSIMVFHKQGKIAHEGFWLWGLAFLPAAYLGYGLAPWLGLPSLAVANVTFLLAYISLALQLRFWRTGQSNIPRWVYLAIIGYFVGFEVLRAYFPYAARATFGQTTIWAMTVYLLVTSIQLYRKTGSIQMLLLGGTFAIESLCAGSRVVLLWLVQIPGPDPNHLLAEPLAMVIIRWVWIVANAMSYLTVMTYVLEKTLNRNEELGSLLKENRQLLTATSKLTRNRNASDTASALTHELAQPLTTIHLASQELQRQLKQPDLEPKTLQTIGDLLESESTRSTRIMKQLELLFRPTNVPRQTLLISQVIDNALSLLSPRLTAHQINIKRSGDFNCSVSGDATQLEAVFMNLIANAMNAMSDTGKQSGARVIEASCLKANNQCIVQVRDNGPGIDVSILDHIGRPYLSDREQGSGIGLWLSKLIVDAHQGTLEISCPPEGGTLARVSLPAW